ncbi:Phosphatidylglycerol/phosphatidylinositol transfer protein [Curvularia kusanoi]|uniref:Phosphatidylglycerol/phosphatidylinositol transfer protein n=1 Tax=Curvularia kusanoi TaxID=90978 RepID=A0A9P4W706_CURKU|nr:Phosphatidylglycerol/phosphatidylinositol transfer protein [Curvularia kusanoi]
MVQQHSDRNLPTSLLSLLTTAAEVHWASLGAVPESWLLSFKDTSGRNNIRWGALLPQRLQNILTKTWHSPHLRFFLGPDNSFIVWHPELIRWANLPPSLEDSLQSWLTPSGWRVGPPRIVTWGPEGAFFAMSEYGDVVYRLGDEDSWEIYKETVEEWKAEKGFAWNELAFIALDPTTSDQFFAIRNDGTWAGSIDDINEDALEDFALNFFAKAKKRQKPQSSQQNSHHNNNGGTERTIPSTNTIPNSAAQALYNQWSKTTATTLAAALAALSASPRPSTPASPEPSLPHRPKPRKLQVRSQSSISTSSSNTPTPPPQPESTIAATLLTTFPYLPPAVTTCALPSCELLKSEPLSIKACRHDVEMLMRASGLYGYEWLRQERLRWHPDRFGRLCAVEWREEGRRMAEEMFKIIDALMEDLNKA